MSLNLTKFTENTDKISSLDDQPSLTASQLKAKFDEGGKAIKTYLNDTLTSEIQTQVENELASNLTSAKNYTDEQVGGINLDADNISYDNTSSGMSATKVQGAIDELKTGLTSASSTASEKIKYSDFDFTTVTLTGTLSPSASKTSTESLSKSGYYPLGIVGEENNQEFIDIRKSQITARASGTGTLSYIIQNEDYGNSRSYTIKFDILWVKVS